MAILSSTQNITGTSSSDMIFGNITLPANNSLSGGDGADLMVGDSYGFVPATSVGATTGTAFNMTSNTNLWTTYADVDILDSTTVPHATAVMEGNGAHKMFRFDMTAGQRLKVDVDYGNHAIGVNVDTKVQILAADGTTVLATGNGNSILGADGSTSNKDGYLSYLVATGGTFYVRVVQSGGANDGLPVPTGATYIANFSLTGQTVGSVAAPLGADTMDGGNGADIMYGGGGNDVITGGDGQDVIYGGDGNDNLQGGLNKDTVYGGAGDDSHFITGATFAENIDGGSGNDLLSLQLRNEGFTVNLTTDKYEFTVNTFGDNGTYWLRSVERIVGSSGADSITGDTSANSLSGFSGNDSVFGGAGADILDGGAGVDTVDGGSGDDLIYVDNAGDVVIEASTGGTSDVVSSAISYTLATGVYVETLKLADAASTSALDLTGNAFSQLIIGNAGNNVLSSGSGATADVMRGLGGNDVYKVLNAADRIDEVSGGGTVDVVEAAVSFKLAGDDHIEFLQTNSATGTTAINLTGNARAQTITGNNGANEINGLKGADVLTGNGGADTFVINTSVKNGNIDTVTDFNVAADTINIDNNIFTSVSNGALAANRFESNTTGEATASSTRFIYESDTGELYYDANGDNAGGSKLILNLSTGLSMTNADIFIL